jgi:hypothetical protein
MRLIDVARLLLLAAMIALVLDGCIDGRAFSPPIAYP